jgi:predicted PurR-regulated permease PerM
MAKKKKKKKPVSPEVKLRRRIKKYLRRALMLATAIFFYFWLLPILVPSLAPQVDQTKQTLISVASQAQEQISQILGSTTSFTAEFTSKKGEIEEKGAETLVQETVDDLTERVKSLPREQVKKVKREFCSDLIEEAVLSATESEDTDKEE